MGVWGASDALPTGRATLLLAAAAVQILVGPPPRGVSWLEVLSDRVPLGGTLPAALGVSVVLSRLPDLIDRLPGSTRSLAEVGLLKASFDVVGCDRTAARIEHLLAVGRVVEAAALLPELRGDLAQPLTEAPSVGEDSALAIHAIASQTIEALARRPQHYVAPWMSYGLFGLRGTMPLLLRSVWQRALGLRGSMVCCGTLAHAGPTVRWVSDGAATAASVALAPLLGLSLAETWRSVESAHSDPEVAAIAVLLDRSLMIDGELVNGQAAPAGPEDVRRARRIAWGIAATMAATSVVVIFTTRLLRRVGLPL